VIALAKRMSKQVGRTIGVYPRRSTDLPRRSRLPLEPRLVNVLQRAGWNHRNAPVFIQSFEQSN